MGGLRAQRPGASARPMLHEAVCGGMCTEAMATAAVGIQFRTLSTSDRKKVTRAFTTCQHDAVEHVFDD
eukprot:13121038-Alexandrium_andersonii.AAC.1